ncbi:MAG: hypothetical protein ACE5G3_00100 [Gammaproteobacteria bacterium]
MRWYNDLVVRVSHSAFLWLMSGVFAFGSLFFVFMNIRLAFEEIVGAPMFDFQNDLTVEQIFAQLQHYDGQAHALYRAFLFVDFYFPFFAGLVLASAAAFAWRHLAPGFYEAIRNRALFALFLIPTLCDWGENTAAIIVVGAYPEELTWAATTLVVMKKCKLATMMLGNAITALSLAAAGLKWSGIRLGLVKR